MARPSRSGLVRLARCWTCRIPSMECSQRAGRSCRSRTRGTRHLHGEAVVVSSRGSPRTRHPRWAAALIMAPRSGAGTRRSPAPLRGEEQRTTGVDGTHHPITCSPVHLFTCSPVLFPHSPLTTPDSPLPALRAWGGAGWGLWQAGPVVAARGARVWARVPARLHEHPHPGHARQEDEGPEGEGPTEAIRCTEIVKKLKP